MVISRRLMNQKIVRPRLVYPQKINPWIHFYVYFREINYYFTVVRHSGTA